MPLYFCVLFSSGDHTVLLIIYFSTLVLRMRFLNFCVPLLCHIMRYTSSPKRMIYAMQKYFVIGT